MFKKLLVVVIVVASLAGLIGIASAWFTDTKVGGDNLFTSGTIILNTSPITATIKLSNMAPGDEFTVPVTVTNAGSLPLRYAVTSVATNTDDKALMGQLDLAIKYAATSENCDEAGFPLYGTPIRADGDLGSLTPGTNVIGDPAQGDDTGDRTLAASASEVLCLNIKLPFASGNQFQGAATTATFTFAGEQTDNNP
jgi:predicted ribosomally synthesized peptide with SipW-like signal peptide